MATSKKVKAKQGVKAASGRGKRAGDAKSGRSAKPAAKRKLVPRASARGKPAKRAPQVPAVRPEEIAIAKTGLRIGSRAPEFTLEADDGTQVSLANLRGKRVVLYFYPKDNTPGCTAQACEYRDLHKVFEDHNAVVLGISRDSAQSHQDFRHKYRLSFPLLMDPDHKVHSLYGAWGEKTLYGNTTIGPIRTTVIIDENGKILKWAGGVRAAGDARNTLAILEKS